jgi:membrane associated rhomboid family serine protease
MTLRTLAREIRDYPATAFFALAWLLIFGAMAAHWACTDPSPRLWRFLVLGINEGHRFGDLTVTELRRGDYWRLITCNFVHFSVIHIALNLLAFYLLGTLVESWYGSPQFIMIYGLTGGLGNLVSAMIRVAIGANPNIHSGGGSVVIMGLIGLCAVVGWRSRTPMGSDLGWQMSKALGLTGLLGIAFPGYIDNWGHAGGALVGFFLGFLHRLFLRQYHRPSAWGLGVMMSLVIGACGVAQIVADRREGRFRDETTAFMQRRVYDTANRAIAVVSLLGESVLEASRVSELLQREAELLNGGVTHQAYRRALTLALNARSHPLTDDEQIEFDLCLGRMAMPLLDGLGPLFVRWSMRAEYQQLRNQAFAAQSRVLTDEEKADFKRRLEPLKTQIQHELEVRIRARWQEKRPQAEIRAGHG